jgi:hypothetical protein
VIFLNAAPPLLVCNFSDAQLFFQNIFQSPQLIKHTVSEQLTQELILGTFVTRLESSEIYHLIKKAVNTFLGFDDVA